MLKEEYEKQKAEIYTNSVIIASFVGHVMNGKKIPEFELVFPDEERKQKSNWLAQKLRMLEAMDKWNEQLKLRKANDDT